MGSSTYIRGGIIFTSVFLILAGLSLVGLDAGLVARITTERNGGTYNYTIRDHVLYGVPQYVMGSLVLIPAGFGISLISYQKSLIIGYLVSAFLCDLGMLAVIGYHGSVYQEISNIHVVTSNFNIGVLFLECLCFVLLLIGIILGAVLLFRFLVNEQRYRHHGAPPPYPLRARGRDREFRAYEKSGWYDPYYQKSSPKGEKVYYEKYPVDRPYPPRGYREAEYY